MIVAKTILEFTAVVLLIYGFIHEKEVIRFEKWLKIKILRTILGVMKWEKIEKLKYKKCCVEDKYDLRKSS